MKTTLQYIIRDLASSNTAAALIAEYANVDISRISVDGDGDVWDGTHWWGEDKKAEFGKWVRSFADLLVDAQLVELDAPDNR